MHRTLREIIAKWIGAGLAVLGFALLSSLSSGALAGQERYDYDPVGRLVRYVDSNNQVTDYTYDAAGNLLSVSRGGNAAGLVPILSTISPGVIRRGETRPITLTGQRLQVGTLQASHPAMDLSNLHQSASLITATLAVGAAVPTGTQTLTFSNAQGAAQIGMLVAPGLPALSVEPSPLALPPDNTARAITLRLSNADLVAHTINIASTDTSRAIVSPASVVIAAGQTAVQVSVMPKLPGFVSLVLTSPTLQTVTAPVFITSDFRGVNTSYAAPVGVLVGDAQGPTAPPLTTASFVSPRVGIAVGPVLTGITPQAMPVGATHSVVITGSNLPGTVLVSLLPSQGVTATAVAVGSASSQISLLLGVDASAAPGARRIVVQDGTGQLVPFADPGMSQVVLTTGQPGIVSIEPMFGKPGAMVQLKVRGTHLHNGRLLITPAVDLQVDNAPAVNAEGTELVARVQIAALAASGPRLVQIATPSGQSSSQPGSANQFTIVSEIKENITPIASPLVGVVVGTSTTAMVTDTIGPVQAAHVGVLVGPAAHAVAPQVGLLGSSVNLVVTGVGLQSVLTASLAPLDGLSVGAFSINAEGTQLTIPLVIDASAPRSPRRVVLSTAAGKLMFSAAGADQFLVVAPAPQIIAVAPQVLATGRTATMSVRGQNFSDVLGVQFDPSAGLVAVPPFVATEGNTVLSFAVQVSGSAASGLRTLIVTTAGGSSSSAPTPANTFQVAQQVGPVRDAIMAPPVGVMVGTSAAPQVTDTMGVYAPLVGVVFNSTATQVTRDEAVFAGNVGVVVGMASTGISPRSPEGFLKGSSGVLVVTGFALDQVTSVAVTGTAGVALGAPVANGEGTQLTIPVNVSATAPSSIYGITLQTGSGTATTKVTATDPAAMFFSVGALPTVVESVSPIVLEQGKSYTFTVRGTGLKDIYQLVANPEPGVRFGVAFATPLWSTDALGEKLTVQLFIDADAAIGSRTVRLRVPGGITDSGATPANTITIVAPL